MDFADQDRDGLAYDCFVAMQAEEPVAGLGGAMLARLGLTAQEPLQRAYQRDAQAVERWQRATYPAIARRRARKALRYSSRRTLFGGP